jgi:hypothetical protein
MQLNGDLTPAYKQFYRLGLHNPKLTVLEFIAVRYGVQITREKELVLCANS